MNRLLFFLLILFLISNVIFATTITSVICGYWTSPTTWDLNRTPVASDSIVVNSFVSFDADFTSLSPGMLNVTECGTICGTHHYTGYFLFNGIIYLSGLTASYGNSISNSDINVQQFLTVTGSGSYVVNGLTCVGCTSLCQNCSANRQNAIPCAPAGISNLSDDNTLYCYPNPATNDLNVKGIKHTTTIRLFDSLGKLVIEVETGCDIILDLRRLSPGLYNFVSEDGKSRTFKRLMIINN